MNSNESAETLWGDKRGRDLIEDPILNRGTAFTEQERRDYGLLGLLPPHVESLDEQVTRAYEAFQAEETDLDKHIYLRQLQDENETLFYRLLLEHVAEMMPIVYTPVVGLACQRFSHIYRRARGIFLSYPDRDHLDQILANVQQDVKVIVVTDGERILGLGDQGAGGMGIPIGKLSLYSLCGGIHPRHTLPMLLDLGTNNPDRLKDPQYIGWRHERIKGDQYDEFVDKFVQAVEKRFPNVLLQWEDFASVDAERLLARYRDQLCTFNDDIQGTAAVTTGTILAAIAATGGQLCDQRFVMLGAGSAGIGITQQLILAMEAEGLDTSLAQSRFYLIDRHGLLHEGRDNMNGPRRAFAQSKERLASWDCSLDNPVTLEDVVRNAKPTVLIGATGQQGAFTEQIVKEMARHTEQPIIFPLSNPTSRAEATPEDLIHWTGGKALVATGSPFEPVTYQDVTHPIAQCNNSYIFPAMGLGILASEATRVTDRMFMAAAMALKQLSPALRDSSASLLPPLHEIRSSTRQVAQAVALAAQSEGVSPKMTASELERRLDETMWDPKY